MNNYDPSLHSPHEANTGKHINFQETEDADTDRGQSAQEDEESAVKQQWREMREEKMNEQADPSLQSPQEANTHKHLNFVETEGAVTGTGRSSAADEENHTKQQRKEMREEKTNDDRDSSLSAPQEANTKKHLNFLETEEAGARTGDSAETDQQTTAQQWKEIREERANKN